MTRIPTVTRRHHVEVRASATGPELPRLHALPTPMPWSGSRTYWSHNRAHTTGLGYRPTGSNVNPSTDRRKNFLPALGDRASTLGAVHAPTGLTTVHIRPGLVIARQEAT